VTDPATPAVDAAPADDEEVAPFRPGVRVALCQYAPEGGSVGRRELGVGEILVRPRIGERLELRIRAERGLASSQIRELRLLGERCLAVGTQGRVYVLTLLEATLQSPDAFELMAHVNEMYAGQEAAAGVPGEVTQYVRIGEPLVRPGTSPFSGRSLRIERTGTEDPDAKPELLGTGRLLAEPEPGLPLRFQVAEGQVVTTSDVMAVERSGDDAFEASTANSRYRFEVILEPSPEHTP